MSISMVEIAGANFRTDASSDKLNTTFMERLGVSTRYLPARLAISRSLSIPTAPKEYIGTNDGRIIKGDTLFGAGNSLPTWVSLIVEHTNDKGIDEKRLIMLVAGHWRRGIDLLNQDWGRANGDLSKFVEMLVDVAELPRTGQNTLVNFDGRLNEADSSKSGVTIPIGEISEDASTTEKVLWDLNGVGGSPHSAIMGGVGSGKTRTAVAMLKSIREKTQVPLIAFDFKGDLASDKAGGGYGVDGIFDAEVISPPRQPIPLNVLALNETDEISINEAASRFRDAFSNLQGSQLGTKQNEAMHQAATSALKTNAECTLENIRDALIDLYAEREMKEDGAVSTMREICRFPLFDYQLSSKDFFQKSYLIKLPPDVTSDSRKLVVNLVLNALNEYLNSLPDAPINENGARNLRIMCMVDEAHQILKQKLPALSNLMRMSRSKGGSVMLISQSPDDFSGVQSDFLAEMGLVAAFSTNAEPRNVKRILGDVNLTTLKIGQCFIKLRGDQNSKRLIAWK